MEEWTAATDEPKRFSQTRVKGCNLCILLVGFRRGCVPEGEELSITQLEYRSAVALGLDVLVFMLDEQAPWPRRFDELEKDAEIRRWRAKLMEHRGVGFFSLNPDSIEIAFALTRWLTEQAIRQPGEVPLARSGAFSALDRGILRFGLSLGWQLERYAVVYGSQFPEARAIQPSVESDIAFLLSQDHFPHPVEGLGCQQLLERVLSYYGATAVEKHAAILLGIAAMRISLVGASRNHSEYAEMEQIAFSALQEIDPRVLPDKNGFFQALRERQPKTVVGILELVESLSQVKSTDEEN